MENKHKIVVYDNIGDCYTAIIDDLDVFKFSKDPMAFLELTQTDEYCDTLEYCKDIDMSGEIIPFEKLAIEIQEAIKTRIIEVEEENFYYRS